MPGWLLLHIGVAVLQCGSFLSYTLRFSDCCPLSSAQAGLLRRSKRLRAAPAGTAGAEFAAAARPAGEVGGMGARAGLLAASTTNDASSNSVGPMGPRKDEHWSQWLERIRPEVVTAFWEAVLPGEQQLEAFKDHITTPGKPWRPAGQYMSVWTAQDNYLTCGTLVFGGPYQLHRGSPKHAGS